MKYFNLKGFILPHHVVFCIFIMFGRSISEVGAQMSFITQPADVQVRSGEEGKFQCILSGVTAGIHCFWNKDGAQIDISDRYQYITNPDNGDCSIKITNSNMEFDDGIWTCGVAQTSSMPGIKSNDARYMVLLAPKDPIIVSNGVQVGNGTDLLVADFNMAPSIECRSENGNPAAGLQWTLSMSGSHPQGNYTVFNETLTANKTQKAVLQLTQRMDETWQSQILACVASHGAYDYNHVAYVYVRNPSSPSNVVIGSDQANADIIQANTHDTVTLYCSADGYPIPTYRWNSRVSEADDWKVYTSNQGPNITFQAFDSQFMCEATNDDLNYYKSNIMEINTTSASSAQIGTIIAIVVVCIVVLVLMGAGVWACYKKHVWPFNAGGNQNGNENGNLENGKQHPKQTVRSDDTLDGQQVRQSLMNEEMEKRDGNVKTDSSPHGKENDEADGIQYAALDFNGNGSSPKPTQAKTVYAQIKPKKIVKESAY